MKTKLLILVLIMSLLTAYTMPPALPSAFYGVVIGGKAGQTVTAVVEGKVVKTTEVFLYEGKPVYALKVYMDDVTDGTKVMFYVAGIIAGKAELYTGTNQNIVLTLPRVILRHLLPIIPMPRKGE